MNQQPDQRGRAIADSVTWFLFAKIAGDRLRAAYWKGLAFLRRHEMRRRVDALHLLPSPRMTIPPETGFETCTLDDLRTDGALVSEVLRLVAEQPDQAAGVKPYLIDMPVTGLTRESALLRFALNPMVLSPIAAYLGMAPRLAGVTILESRSQPGAPAGSQLFHCDYEDVRQVKVFVNCSDIGPENGPLHAIPAAESRRIKGAIHYKYGNRRFRVPDSVVADLVSNEGIVEFTGPPGAVAFLDTSSCLHYGSRIEPGAERRLVVQFQYITPAAFELVIAPSLRRPPVADGAGCSPLEKLVLGIS